MSKIKVLVIPSDRTGVSHFRSIEPHIALEVMFPDEFEIEIDYELNKLDDDNFYKKYDMIHYHRTLGPYEKNKEVIDRCRRLGVLTFMDIDDHWSPGPHHPAYEIIKANEVDKKTLANLQCADNIITTTPIYVEELKRVTGNDNVFVVPNAIDPSEKQFTPNPEKSDRIRIGWLGGSSHLHDLELLKGVVGRLANDGLMDKVQFVLCGYDLRGNVTFINEKGEQKQRPITPKESVWYKYEQIFTDDYKIVSKKYKDWLHKFKKEEYEDLANEPYRRVWTKPITTYASNYNLFDISLAPLEENMFNKCKSQLKVIEAGFHKKALIAQDFGPYQIDLINANKQVLAAKGEKHVPDAFNKDGNAYMVSSRKNHKQWYQYLKKLIENPEQIEILRNNLYDTVKDTYSMDAATKVRRDIYVKAMKSKKAETSVENVA